MSAGGNLDSVRGSYTVADGTEVLATGDQHFGAAQSHFFYRLGDIGFDEYLGESSRYIGAGETTAAATKVKEGALYRMQMFRLFGTHHVAVGSVDPFRGRMLSSNETRSVFVAKEN